MAATKYVAGFEYSWSELLALWKECYARISVSGQSYQMTFGGGTDTYTSADLEKVWNQIQRCQAMVNAETSAAAGDGGAQNLVRFARSA